MKRSAFICILFFLASLQQSKAIIRYVSPTGAGLMDGTNWANAFPGTALQATINASVAGDEVWVMTGTYLTTTTNNRNIYFSMLNGVAIYGSFNGTETDVSQRIFSCGFTSVLSAEIGAAGIADNSYHVISNSSLNNTAILDGFTIRDANADFDLLGNDSRSLGGGMLNNAANGGTCSPTIRNCLFTNNTALFGGGIFDHGQNAGNANPVITNCIFAFNTATSGGGGIDNFGYNGNASPVITNTIFYANTAVNRAGGMYCWGGGNGNTNPVILNCAFINNSAIDGGGIVSDRSNFVSGNSGNSNPTIRNSIFWGNTASGTGPQFFLIGGAGFIATFSAVDISNQNVPHIISGAGTGNIFVSPSFLNISSAAGPDDCWLNSDDGLQLQTGSPGINAGDNTGVPVFDIRNFNRVVNGVVDMGPYEFNSTVLAARLKDFYGKANKNANTLFWSTASENNSRVFEIEKSTDGLNFKKAGEVPGAGNSTDLRHYRFTDDKLTSAKNYYRLKQVDNTGRYVLSNIILLSNKHEQGAIVVWPNPVRDIATLLFEEDIKPNEEFILLSSTGQMAGKYFITGRTGSIDLSGKATGLYLLFNHKLGISVKIYKAAN